MSLKVLHLTNYMNVISPLHYESGNRVWGFNSSSATTDPQLCVGPYIIDASNWTTPCSLEAPKPTEVSFDQVRLR